MSNCSSASLSSSGVSFRRSAQVFFTIAAPAPEVVSATVSEVVGFLSCDLTIQRDDPPKVDLGVKEGLDGGGDIIRVIVVFAVASTTMIVVVI